MKALFLVVLLLAMGFFLYKQSDDITTLQASLDDEKAKTAQLQSDLNTAKAALAAATKANAAVVNQNPLAKPPAQPGAAATPSGNWMWNKNAGTLDQPASRK